jgi:hypothetical protein
MYHTLTYSLFFVKNSYILTSNSDFKTKIVRPGVTATKQRQKILLYCIVSLQKCMNLTYLPTNCGIVFCEFMIPIDPETQWSIVLLNSSNVPWQAR